LWVIRRFSRIFAVVFVDLPEIRKGTSMSTFKTVRITVQNGRVEVPYIWDVENPEGYGNRIGRYRTDVESRFMFDHLGPSPLRILDMGGGSGRFGGALSAQGHRVTLIDKNPQAVALARKRGVQRAMACDISDFHEGEFDGVVCMEVLQYFDKCDPVFAKAAESLKAGGTFVFCFTNARSWRFRLRSLKENNHSVTAFSMEEIERCLASYRFEVTGRKGFQWSLAQTGSDSRIVDASIWIEKRLGLQNWLSQSPWLLYACRKIGE
jgi:2-polyprenyl-3-methyl-5-hydroxy-6-metoxy-1,4-benzoquinol methylase